MILQLQPKDFDSLNKSCRSQFKKGDDPGIRALRRIDPSIRRIRWESHPQYTKAYNLMEVVRKRLRKGEPYVTISMEL